MGKIKSKWDSLDKGVQKWATRISSILVIAGAIVGAGTWLLNQLDARFSSQTTELKSEIDEVKLSSTRNELLLLMETDPENVVAIERIARTYFLDLKGDTYMSGMYSKYCKAYGADCGIVVK